jgi:NhaP-type Na+/H+ or K+/H+ antiporter
VPRGEQRRSPGWRLIAATSLAGVRGAITLAGILTLPLALLDGTPFPGRDLAIFLAAGVIIVSMTAASLGLPFLLTRRKGLDCDRYNNCRTGVRQWRQVAKGLPS